MHPRTFTFRRAQAEDYPDMLALQAENFIGNLEPGQARDGFLSIEYTTAQFGEIVSEKNPRSLHAHLRKLGMRHLGTFVFAESRFHMLGAAITQEKQP